MTDTASKDSSTTPPDRLAAHPSSPFYNEAALERGVGVRFKGAERNDVDEYCVSEGWIRVALGKKVDRKGAALTIKLTGPLEVWFRDVGPDAATGAPAETPAETPEA
ncbi:MAG: DUF3297 family protein [Sphingomonadales bacterium]